MGMIFSGGKRNHARTYNREDHNSREHGREAIRQTDHDGVTVAVIVHRIVRGERYQTAEGQTQREEDLRSGLQPDHRIGQRIPLQSTEAKRIAFKFCYPLNRAY